MLKPGPAKRLTVTINETVRWHGCSADNVLSGCRLLEGSCRRGTAPRGIAGFSGRGARWTPSTSSIWRPTSRCVLKLVDAAEAIERVPPDVYDMVEKGLVEVQDTTVIKFVTREEAASTGGQEGRRADAAIGKA